MEINLKPVSLLFLSTVTMTGCVSMRAPSSQTNFFVEDAESVLNSCTHVEYKEAAVACHRITPGGALVVGVRQYSDKGGDREFFKKITFVINGDVVDGEIIELPSDRVRAAYSSGLSFMPGKSGCVGQAKSGTVSIFRKDKEKLTINADVKFDLISPLGWANTCETLEFSSELVATRSSFEDMGPWEGVINADDSLISESAPVNAKK